MEEKIVDNIIQLADEALSEETNNAQLEFEKANSEKSYIETLTEGGKELPRELIEHFANLEGDIPSEPKQETVEINSKDEVIFHPETLSISVEKEQQNEEIVNSEDIDKTKPEQKKRGNPNPNWVKGVSGNPNGRPKGTFSFIPLLKKALKERYLNTDKKTAEVVVERLIDEAIKQGNVKAMQELMDRIDGKPAQTIKGDKENPISVIPLFDLTKIREEAEENKTEEPLKED